MHKNFNSPGPDVRFFSIFSGVSPFHSVPTTHLRHDCTRISCSHQKRKRIRSDFNRDVACGNTNMREARAYTAATATAKVRMLETIRPAAAAAAAAISISPLVKILVRKKPTQVLAVNQEKPLHHRLSSLRDLLSTPPPPALSRPYVCVAPFTSCSLETRHGNRPRAAPSDTTPRARIFLLPPLCPAEVAAACRSEPRDRGKARRGSGRAAPAPLTVARPSRGWCT